MEYKFFFSFQALAGLSGQHLPGNMERGSYSGVFLACSIKAENISSASAYPCSEPPKRQQSPYSEDCLFSARLESKGPITVTGSYKYSSKKEMTHKGS